MRLILAALFLFSQSASAQAPRISGEVGTTLQLGMSACSALSNCRFLNFRNTNVVRLAIDAAPSKGTELLVDVSLRNINFTQVETLDDTGQIEKIQPLDVRINEARITLFDLFSLSGLDLSAGALRMAWGTADGVSVLDRINPYNLEDGTGFDKRLASPAVMLGWTWGSVRLEMAAIPLFTPAVLPVDEIDFTAMGNSQQVLSLEEHSDGEPPNIMRVETIITTAQPTLSNIQTAARLRWGSPIGDLSLVFYRGFESLPQASGELLLTGFQTQNRVNIGVPLVYPRVMMAGADFRGPLFGRVSGWFEVAVIFPESARLTSARNQLEQLVKLGRLNKVPDPLPSQSTQKSEPYIQAVAGLDATLAGDLYVNLQYLRGMPTERQSTDLHHYAVLALRLPLFEGKLEIRTNGAIEIDNEVLGFQAGGGLSWLHGDAARLSLDCSFMGGKSGATFERFESLSHTRLSFSLGF